MKKINLAKLCITMAILVSSSCAFSNNKADVLDIFLADKTYQVQPGKLDSVIGKLVSMKTESKDDIEWILISDKIHAPQINNIRSRYQAHYTKDVISSWSLLNHTLFIKDSDSCFDIYKSALLSRLGKADIDEISHGIPRLEWLVKEYYGVKLTIEDKMCKLKFVIYQGDGY